MCHKIILQLLQFLHLLLLFLPSLLHLRYFLHQVAPLHRVSSSLSSPLRSRAATDSDVLPAVLLHIVTREKHPGVCSTACVFFLAALIKVLLRSRCGALPLFNSTHHQPPSNKEKKKSHGALVSLAESMRSKKWIEVRTINECGATPA